MNYYRCDHITWKASLRLLFNDSEGQRIYSNLWQMTRDVLMLSTTLSATGSLFILIFGLFHLITNSLSGSAEQTKSLFDIFIISLACPATITIPLAWILAYFGYYKNYKKINSILQRTIAALPEVENVECTTSPVSYVVSYKHKEFYIFFRETGNHRTVSVARGELGILLPYQDTQQRTTEQLFEEIKGYLVGKLTTSFAMGPQHICFIFSSNHLPAPADVREAAETLLYLMERFQLQTFIVKQN